MIIVKDFDNRSNTNKEFEQYYNNSNYNTNNLNNSQTKNPNRVYINEYKIKGVARWTTPFRYAGTILLHATAYKVTVTITVVNLRYIWEELILCNPLQWEYSLLAAIWV